MADLRISQLNALTGADLASEDLLVAVDDSASETKKLTVGDLIANGVTVIADDTIPGAKILFEAGGIATADLADGAVTTAKLADDGVTAAKLADESTVDLVTELPATGAFTGQLALDTDDNFLYLWDGSAWVSLKAAGSINTVNGDTAALIDITATTSGTTVTIAASIDDTTVANQFLAGPTGAGGTVAYRVIDSTDLPTASTTAKGAVLVNGEGLRMDGDTIEVDNDVTDTTTHHVVTYSAKGLITGGRVLTSADLPLATSTDAGAIIPGDGLAVDVNGNLSIDNTVAAGTYTKVTVTDEGVVSTGDTLDADDIPDHSAAKLTSGTISSAIIADDAVTAAKLADESTTLFAGATASDDVTTFPDGDFKGQFFYDETGQDLYIYTGTAFVPITVLSGNLVNAGAYNASTNLMSSVTTAGSSAGFSVGSALPAPAGVNLNHYVVVDTSGTGTGAAPSVSLAPPDMLLSQGVGTEYQLIDVSNAIAGQTASNISLIATGDITATDVQAGIQELDTEKLPKAGGTMTGDLTLNNVNVVFEGATADDYETTLTVTDPTADRTITLPDVTGTVVTTGDTGSVTSTMITDGTIVNADISASAEIAVSKLANGTARQLLQTDSTGNDVEFTSDVDVPGTLDVAGAVTLDSTASVAGVLSADGNISVPAGTAALPSIYSGTDTNTGIYSPGADQFGIATAGTARFYIAADGDIGVGTTSPRTKLDVAATGSNTAALSDTVTDYGIAFTSATTSNYFSNGICFAEGDNVNASIAAYDAGSGGAQGLVFGTGNSNTEKLRITSDGNVGIGATTPAAKLEINSGTGPTDQALLVSDYASLPVNTDFTAQISTYGQNSSELNGSKSGLYVQAGFNRNVDIARFSSIGTSFVDVPRMVIKDSGNVGIGTGSPQARLHVSNDQGGSTGRILFDADVTSGYDALIDATDTGLEFTAQSSSRGFVFNTGSSPTPKVSISPAGNVGIGTSSPNHLLHLSSAGSTVLNVEATGANDSRVRITAGDANISYVEFADTSDIDTGEIRYEHSTNNMQFRVNGNAEAMRIDSSGNVGIGTSSPDRLVHIQKGDAGSAVSDGNTALMIENNSHAIIQMASPNNVSARILFGDPEDADAGRLTYDHSLNALLIHVNASEAMRINSSGNVGIGTISPATALHVVGTARVSTLAGTGNRAVYSAPSGSLTNSSSDGTLKTNVTTLGSQLEVVKQLNPISFNWIDTEERGEQLEIGFIAQEVQPLVPEVIGVNSDETLSVDYPKMVATLTKALQEAIAKIETLETKVAALEAAN